MSSPPRPRRRDPALVELLRAAIDTAAGDDGFAPPARVGSIATNRKTDFDPGTYGHPELGGPVRAIGLFHIDTRHPGEGKPPVLYIRDPMATTSSAGTPPSPTDAPDLAESTPAVVTERAAVEPPVE